MSSRSERDVYRVGLTGNIASGKSAVARVWRDLGAAVIDADELARDAVVPGSPGLDAVVRRFGRDVLAADGTLDRAALRAIVFDDEAARTALESLLHPVIERLRREREAQRVAEGASIVVHEVPLLFEVGMDAAMDVVVFVDAAEAMRHERLVTTRGLDRDEALAMMDAQESADRKRELAGIVVRNDGTLEDLRRRAEAAWRDIEARAAADRR
jgi:dephospho-CoA kinase